MMRLDKFLCETGFGTRSQVKEMLKKGQVTVNGVAAKKPEQKIDEHKDQITCQGKTASYEKHVYYMLHKPAGVVSATHIATLTSLPPVVLSPLPAQPVREAAPSAASVTALRLMNSLRFM